MRAQNPSNPLLLSQLMLLGLLASSSAVLAHEGRIRAPAPNAAETAPAAEFCSCGTGSIAPPRRSATTPATRLRSPVVPRLTISNPERNNL